MELAESDLAQVDGKKPPEPSPGGRKERKSGFEGVGARTVLSLRRFYTQSHLLAQRAADEPTDRLRLPAGIGDQIFQGCPVRALQQLQHLGGLAAMP